MPPPDTAEPSQLRAQTQMTPAQRVYVTLAALSVSSLLIADIIGIKLFRLDVGVWTVEHTCGMLTFPITFLLTDLVNEYFGQKAARRVVWLGLAMGLFVFAVVNIARHMPHLPAPYNVDAKSFEDVFAGAQIMYVASLAAYLVGNFADIFMFHRIKRATGGRYVWLRATGSTIVSQFIDSFIVTWLAFKVGPTLFAAGKDAMTMEQVLKTALTGYTLKFVLAIGITPLIYLGRWIIHRYFGLVPLPARAD